MFAADMCAGFEPTTPAMSRLAQSGNAIDDFWRGFEIFLKQTNNHRSTQDRLNYAHRYIHTLQQADGSELLELSPEKRIHAMKSLAALAKYMGCYDRSQQIRQKFQLKWSNADPIHDFSLILNNGKDLNYMLSWVKDTHSRLPRKYANVLMFNTLTGLRPSEAYLSIKLIHENLENYLNDDTKILEHFRFPHFIRRTKKAYISVVNDRILEMARSSHKEVSYNQLKFQFKREDIGAIHILFLP
jgi:hypothetical protein